MEYICHRVNKLSELENQEYKYGVEIDLRDNLNGKIYMEHDPFTFGQDFEEYLSNYRHGTMILNIKSERIEHKVLDLLRKYQVSDYFFLDSSFPMIKLLTDMGEDKIAIRYSEFEGLEMVERMAGKAKWAWVDCFTYLPIDHGTYSRMKDLGYKLCLVSPELQGQDEKIEAYAEQLKREGILFDAICTKRYNVERWQRLLA